MAVEPEKYFFPPTEAVPNSILPVLVYRDVLPRPHSESTTQELVESNRWTKKGTWGAVPRAHFHPNTHECYAVIRGKSLLRIGCGPEGYDDIKSYGKLILLRAGDVIVLPAGVAHCSIDNDPEYQYIGAYPQDAPRWKNEYGKTPSSLKALRDEAAAVIIPLDDPITGKEGSLPRIWTENGGSHPECKPKFKLAV